MSGVASWVIIIIIIMINIIIIIIAHLSVGPTDLDDVLELLRLGVQSVVQFPAHGSCSQLSLQLIVNIKYFSAHWYKIFLFRRRNN